MWPSHVLRRKRKGAGEALASPCHTCLLVSHCLCGYNNGGGTIHVSKQRDDVITFRCLKDHRGGSMKDGLTGQRQKTGCRFSGRQMVRRGTVVYGAGRSEEKGTFRGCRRRSRTATS